MIPIIARAGDVEVAHGDLVGLLLLDYFYVVKPHRTVFAVGIGGKCQVMRLTPGEFALRLQVFLCRADLSMECSWLQ